MCLDCSDCLFIVYYDLVLFFREEYFYDLMIVDFKLFYFVNKKNKVYIWL